QVRSASRTSSVSSRVAYRPGSDHVESRRPRRLTEAVVIREDGCNIKTHCRLKMQGVEGTQIRHRQESSGPICGPVKCRQRHAIQNRADLRLITPLPHCHATQFSLE